MAHIKYISARAQHEDHIYSTGTWTTGDVKTVPDDVAKKMLRHTDVFAVATPEEAPNAPVVIIEKPKEDKIQNLYDDIANMGKDAIKSFVKTNFNRGIDMRQTEQKLRAYAVQLLDQYGTV